MADCYVGLGGNFDQSFFALQESVKRLAALDGITQLRTSRLYRTSPVSDLPQPPFLNMVCRFTCAYSPLILWEKLENLEKKMGKVPKAKNAPRLIDLDLLFYGNQVYQSKHLTIPHPRWNERLFVLVPLADLTSHTPFNLDIQKMLKTFSNPHHEEVSLCQISI